MNSKERLDGFVRGKSVDRRPNLTIVGSVVTQYTEISVEEYCKDYEKMTRSAILCAKDAGLDYVQIASDLLREAEGFGTQVAYYPDKLPTAVSYALDDIRQAEQMQPLKVREVSRIWDLVKATKLALESEEDIYPMTLAVGPVTVAGNIRGVEDFLMDIYDEPEACQRLLDIVTETTLDLVDELAAVGAKYMYLADPVASLLSPSCYKDMALSCHKRIYSHMASLGICGRLHMCGNTEAILPYSSTCGARIIDIDHAVDYTKAVELVQGRCILNGNIDPVADVYACDAEHTYNAIRTLGEKIGKNGCMFMPGCELPTKTSLENVRAIGRAIQALGETSAASV